MSKTVQAGVSWAYPSLLWKPLAGSAGVFGIHAVFGPVEHELHRLRQWSRANSAIAVQHGSAPEVPAFESPAAVVSLICHYRATWFIAVVAGSRKGLGPLRIDAPDLRRSQQNGSNDPECPSRPNPDEAVIARVTAIPLPLTTVAISLLFKASSIQYHRSTGTSRPIDSSPPWPSRRT